MSIIHVPFGNMETPFKSEKNKSLHTLIINIGEESVFASAMAILILPT